MPAVTAAAISGGATIVGGLMGSRAAKKSAQAAQQQAAATVEATPVELATASTAKVETTCSRAELATVEPAMQVEEKKQRFYCSTCRGKKLYITFSTHI